MVVYKVMKNDVLITVKSLINTYFTMLVASGRFCSAHNLG